MGKSGRKGGGARGAPAGPARGPLGVLGALAALLAALAGALLLGSSGWGGATDADVAGLARLAALDSDAAWSALLGSAADPKPVPRLQWDPDEPLQRHLATLRFPAVLNATEIERWPARGWDLGAIRRALPAKIKADVSADSGTMVYRDNKMAAVKLAASLGGSVGVRTHTTRQLTTDEFFAAVEDGQPYVRCERRRPRTAGRGLTLHFLQTAATSRSGRAVTNWRQLCRTGGSLPHPRRSCLPRRWASAASTARTPRCSRSSGSSRRGSWTSGWEALCVPP